MYCLSSKRLLPFYFWLGVQQFTRAISHSDSSGALGSTGWGMQRNAEPPFSLVGFHTWWWSKVKVPSHSQPTYCRLYPAEAMLCTYDLTKIHKEAASTQLCTILSNTSPPWAGKTPHHIQNSSEFTNQFKMVRVSPPSSHLYPQRGNDYK